MGEGERENKRREKTERQRDRWRNKAIDVEALCILAHTKKRRVADLQVSTWDEPAPPPVPPHRRRRCFSNKYPTPPPLATRQQRGPLVTSRRGQGRRASDVRRRSLGPGSSKRCGLAGVVGHDERDEDRRRWCRGVGRAAHANVRGAVHIDGCRRARSIVAVLWTIIAWNQRRPVVVSRVGFALQATRTRVLRPRSTPAGRVLSSTDLIDPSAKLA